MTNKYYPTISVIGAILLLGGAIIQITQAVWAPYVYLVGAILFAYVQVTDRYEGANLIIRRLRRQQMLGAALLVLAGVMMILWHRNEWILCLTIAAILELYTAFRIPQEEQKKNNNIRSTFPIQNKNGTQTFFHTVHVPFKLYSTNNRHFIYQPLDARILVDDEQHVADVHTSGALKLRVISDIPRQPFIVPVETDTYQFALSIEHR